MRSRHFAGGASRDVLSFDRSTTPGLSMYPRALIFLQLRAGSRRWAFKEAPKRTPEPPRTAAPSGFEGHPHTLEHPRNKAAFERRGEPISPDQPSPETGLPDRRIQTCRRLSPTGCIRSRSRTTRNSPDTDFQEITTTGRTQSHEPRNPPESVIEI